MLSSIKEFLSKHKRKYIIAGVVIGGAVLGSRYAQRKFIEWQEKEAKEFLERTRKQHYFESTEKTCNQTIISLSVNLRENINKLVNCDKLIREIRKNPSNKVELWQELKILVFTKVSLLIYCGTLIVIALRIQLNVIGGHIYCKSLTSNTDSKATNDLQEKYLSQCHYFLNKGMRETYPLIKRKVESAIKDITLKQMFTIQQMEHVFWAIQSVINDDTMSPLKNMSNLLYGYEFKCEDTLIKEIMLDTFDLLQSSEVIDLASSCVSRGFSNVIDKISEFFLPDEKGTALCSYPSTSKNVNHSSVFVHPKNVLKPFAKIIPIVNSFGNEGASADSCEAWIAPFIYMDNIKMLGANIYESYSYQN